MLGAQEEPETARVTELKVYEDGSGHLEFSMVPVRNRIDEVIKDRIPPMTLNTLKEKNRELYRTLRLADAH